MILFLLFQRRVLLSCGFIAGLALFAKSLSKRRRYHILAVQMPIPGFPPIKNRRLNLCCI